MSVVGDEDVNVNKVGVTVEGVSIRSGGGLRITVRSARRGRSKRCSRWRNWARRQAPPLCGCGTAPNSATSSRF